MLSENHIPQPASVPHLRRHPMRWRIVCAALGVLLLAGLAAGAALYSNPALVPAAVDTVRAIFGPSAVAQIEAWTFQAQDSLRQARYQATGTVAHTQWAVSPPAAPPKLRPSVAV